jgi:hypothetical protein
VTGHRLDNWCLNPSVGRDFFLHHPKPPTQQILEVKLPGHEMYYSTSHVYLPPLSHIFMTLCLGTEATLLLITELLMLNLKKEKFVSEM